MSLWNKLKTKAAFVIETNKPLEHVLPTSVSTFESLGLNVVENQNQNVMEDAIREARKRGADRDVVANYTMRVMAIKNKAIDQLHYGNVDLKEKLNNALKEIARLKKRGLIERIFNR